MAYTKTLWKTGDIVTQEKMNKIEQGIKSMELPVVTSEDDGKVLTVIDGQWGLGDGSGSSSGSLNIIVNMTLQGQAQSGAPIYNFTTDTKWSELLDAYRNDLEIRLTAKQPIDENSNDTSNVVAIFAFFQPSYNDSTPSSDIDKGKFYFNSIGYVSYNGNTLTGFNMISFALSKSLNDEIYFDYYGAYKKF